MKEQLEQHVKRVKELHELCRGNEQATKQSLIAPLFAILGYDMSDPRVCKPEYKADFGKGEKASTPVDWAFLINVVFAFFVEAKEVGAKLKKYAEQLGMYFGKGQPHAKLGIYTNGLQWLFYTDLDTSNVMDKEPFLTWDVLEDEIPFDFLTILQKSQFSPQLVRTFAERKHHQSLLVDELNYLLDPSPEFIRLAVKNPDRPIETGTLTQAKIEAWKPILASAIQEWAKQYTLKMALHPPVTTGGVEAPAEVTDRAYWESKASKETLLATDDLFKLVKEVQAKATLNYNKYYIGLEIDGSSRNFATFVPQKSRVLVNIKLSQGKEIDDQLDEAGIETLPYDTQGEQYRVRSGSAVNEKQRGLLLRLIRQAWEDFGKP